MYYCYVRNISVKRKIPKISKKFYWLGKGPFQPKIGDSRRISRLVCIHHRAGGHTIRETAANQVQRFFEHPADDVLYSGSKPRIPSE